MSEQDCLALQGAWLETHEEIASRLTHCFGCRQAAADAVQGAWLRLARAVGVARVEDPRAYLLRIAANTAFDERRAERRRVLMADELAALLDVPEDVPGPEEAVIARLEMEQLSAALAELPARCRDIFLAARLHGTAHCTLAARFGVSLRTVDAEIRRALDHCAARLDRVSPSRCKTSAPKPS